MSAERTPEYGNPTMTVELADNGTTVIGVFRKGRIGRGGSLTRVDDRSDEAAGMWHGQTARRNDLGMEPVYRGRNNADGLLKTLRELDRELRDGWIGSRSSGDATAPTEAHRVALLADNDGTQWPAVFNDALAHAGSERWLNETPDPSPRRYEWPDGSAIVTLGATWALGVHADRLADAATRYTPPEHILKDRGGIPTGHIPEELNLMLIKETRFAWPDAGYGLEPSDSLPLDGN